jgi:hypothetical protein
MTFLSSNPIIYDAQQVGEGGYLQKLKENDYGGMFGFLQEMDYIFDAADGRWRRPGRYRNIMSTTPWCHQKGIPQKHCSLDHDIMFNRFKIITPRCLQCWKVVVTPRTFDELMKLKAMEAYMDVPSKCGIEMRDYTPKFYGGYFYNNSFEEGRACLEEVKKNTKEFIGPEVADEVILKRGCTEYEMVVGPSPYWHITEEQEGLYEIAQSLIDVPRGAHVQDILQQRMVQIKWFLWAHMNGDMSYKEYNGGKALFPGYVKYNDGDIETVKRDLMVAHAQAKYGTPIDKSLEFIELAQNFAEEQGFDSVGKLGASLGWDNTNTYRFNKVLDEIPQEVKGEHDELT